MRAIDCDHDVVLALALLFRELGDPTRLAILSALLDRERTVTELIRITGAPQGRVSNHLACLRWSRLVTAERHGRHRTYRVADPRLGSLLIYAAQLVRGREDLARAGRIGPAWI